MREREMEKRPFGNFLMFHRLKQLKILLNVITSKPSISPKRQKFEFDEILLILTTF